MTAPLKSFAGLVVLRQVTPIICATCSDTGTVVFHERLGTVQQPCRDCGGCAVWPLRRQQKG